MFCLIYASQRHDKWWVYDTIMPLCYFMTFHSQELSHISYSCSEKTLQRNWTKSICISFLIHHFIYYFQNTSFHVYEWIKVVCLISAMVNEPIQVDSFVSLKILIVFMLSGKKQNSPGIFFPFPDLYALSCSFLKGLWFRTIFLEFLELIINTLWYF